MKRVILTIFLATALTGCGDITWFPTPKAVPSISTSSLPDAPTGIAYSQTLAATGGGGAPYSWALATGSSLPPGLTLSSTGTISGTPATEPDPTVSAGTYSFTVTASDTQTPPGVGQKSLSILVPTTGRMYDTSHTVYADNLTYDTAANQITIEFGNVGTIAHTVQATVANYDANGAEIAGSRTTITSSQQLQPPATSGGATTLSGTLTLTTPSATNDWHIRSVNVL